MTNESYCVYVRVRATSQHTSECSTWILRGHLEVCCVVAQNVWRESDRQSPHWMYICSSSCLRKKESWGRKLCSALLRSSHLPTPWLFKPTEAKTINWTWAVVSSPSGDTRYWFLNLSELGAPCERTRLMFRPNEPCLRDEQWNGHLKNPWLLFREAGVVRPTVCMGDEQYNGQKQVTRGGLMTKSKIASVQSHSRLFTYTIFAQVLADSSNQWRWMSPTSFS